MRVVNEVDDLLFDGEALLLGSLLLDQALLLLLKVESCLDSLVGITGIKNRRVVIVLQIPVEELLNGLLSVQDLFTLI